MAESANLSAKGLAFDANTIAAGAGGGMQQARNVMIRRDNVIEPRMGFATDEDFDAVPPAGTKTCALIERGDRTIIISRDGTDDSYDIRYDTNTSITGLGLNADQQPMDSSEDFHRWAYSRGNLYVTSDAGLCKLDLVGDTTFTKTLSETPTIGLSVSASVTAANDWMPTDTSANYQVCFVRTDLNGYIFRNAPSPLQKIYNGSGGDRSVIIVVPMPVHAVAGDQIEVYRSLLVSGDVAASNEVFLSFTHTVTSSDISTGSVSLRDSAGDDLHLGAALYTNPGQQGVNGAAYPSPPSGDATEFQQCVWLSNIRNFPAMLVQLNTTNLDSAMASGNFASWLGIRSTVTSTAIVATDTTVTIPTGLSAEITVGAVITLASANPPGVSGPFASLTKVTAYDNGTGVVTFSPAATGGLASGQTIWFHDVIAINSPDGAFTSREFYASTIQDNANHRFDVNDTPNATTSYEQLTAINLSRCISAVMHDDGIVATAGAVNEGGGAYLSIRLLDKTDNFEVETNRGAAFTPNLQNLPNANQYDYEAHPNRLFYSKPNEPEAFPILNYLDIGDSQFRIMRIISLRDSMLVFKEDGVYRVTGFAPSDWRVDLCCSEDILVNSRMITEMDEIVYAWCTTQVKGFDAQGNSSDISDQLIGTAVRGMNLSLVTNDADDLINYHCYSHKRFKLITYQGPEYHDENVKGIVYKLQWQFCPETQTWVNWDLRIAGTTASLYHVKRQQAIYACDTDPPTFRLERIGADDEDPSLRSDEVIPITIQGVTGTAVTLDSIGAWVPQVGDYLEQDSNGVFYLIVEIQSATVVIVDREGMLGFQDTIAYEGIRTILEWMPVIPESPAMNAHWRELQLMFSALATDLDDITFFAGGLNDSSLSNTPSVVEGRQAAYSSMSKIWRVWLPRQIHRGSRLAPYFEQPVLTTYWNIEGAALIYEPMSERTRRDW